MSEPFLGEIRMVGFSFPPRGWAFCQGQILGIAQNSALFSLLGTTYGGNGQTTFGLPDLRGRAPVGTGTGGQLPPVQPGEMAGTQAVTLTINNLPAHNHLATLTMSGAPAVQINVTDTIGSSKTAGGNMLAQTPAAGPSQALIYAPADSPVSGQLAGVAAAPGTLAGNVQVQLTGNSQPVAIQNPYLGVNFVIALSGIFPSRN